MTTNAMAVQQDSVVANLQRASTALAEAKTIQQTKQIIDVAAAAEIYAKRQQLGDEAIGIATAVKLDALRKLGEMLKETPKAKVRMNGKNFDGSKKEPSKNDAPTLAELGLDKKTSAVAQKLADLPQDAFEQVREGRETIAKAIAAVKETKDAIARPGAKPNHPEPADETPDAPPDDYPDFSTPEGRVKAMHATVAMQADQIQALKDRLVVAGEPEGGAATADDLIAELRKEIRVLEITVEAVTRSRDQYMTENASLKKQCQSLLRQIKKAG